MVPKDDEPADVRGHVCNHERTPSGDPIEQSPPSSWVPYDNEQHTRSVTAYQTWVCSYCDAMGRRRIRTLKRDMNGIITST